MDEKGLESLLVLPVLEIIYNKQYKSVLPKSRLRYCKGQPIKSAVYCLNKHLLYKNPFSLSGSVNRGLLPRT